MNLAAIGETTQSQCAKRPPVCARPMRPDGSWPIDTNLSTWLTTWAIAALKQPEAISAPHRSTLQQWF
jgi:squalene-hopene/tetraprenyl-beta-curcumene cyclase